MQKLTPVHWRQELRLIGIIFLGLGVIQIPALLIGIFAADEGLVPLAKSIGIVLALGGIIFMASLRGQEQEVTHRDALLLVAFIWFAAGFAGSLPFYFSSYFSSLTDAVFECISGFTTTGASVLDDVEVLPPSLLFWRTFTNWLGGLGIIVLMIAVLPLVGTGGMALYRAEFSGSRSERVKPRLAATAAALWKIYLGFTAFGFVALMLSGLSSFDAICHTFSSLGTGGFSTKSKSIEAFENPAAEAVLILLMVAGGLNFAQHYRLLMMRRIRAFWVDTETRYYLFFLTAASLIVTLELSWGGEVSPLRAFRLASFNVVSIMTTTGFSSVDFGLWGPLSQALLFCLMFIGGCTGSTGGGLKVARVAIVLKEIQREFKVLLNPRAIHPIQFSGRILDERFIFPVLVTVVLAVLTFVMGVLVLTLTGVDPLSAMSGAAACMLNIGPGLGAFGPAANYSEVTPVGKWTLAFLMVAGRLEWFNLMVVFTIPFWRK